MNGQHGELEMTPAIAAGSTTLPSRSRQAPAEAVPIAVGSQGPHDGQTRSSPRHP